MQTTDKKLLDRACTELCRSVRDTIRLKHYSIRTVCPELAEGNKPMSIGSNATSFNLEHPKDMGSPEIEAFLTHLAVEQNVAAPI